MPTAVDRLVTSFENRGTASLLNALTGVAKAQDRIAAGETKLANTTNAGALARAQQQIQDGTAQLAQANMRLAASYAAIGTAVVAAMGKAIAAYTRFGHEVMNVQGLTGGSAAEAAKLVGLSRAAGVSDSQALQQIVNLSRNVFQGSGQSALARLGIPASPNQSGLELFSQVADRLSGMQDGIRKTQIMEQLFGQTGVQAMLPLLRLTKEQREAAIQLGSAFDTNALKVIQKFDFSTAMLGETFQQKFLAPLARHVLPALTTLAEFLERVISGVNRLDNMMGGALSWVAAWAGIALAIGSVVKTVQIAIAAFNAARAAAMALAGAEAVAATAAGDVTAIPRLAAAVAAVGITLGAAGYAMGGGSESGATQTNTKFSRAVDKFEIASLRLSDAAEGIQGGGLPGKLTSLDAGALAKRMGLGAIG